MLQPSAQRETAAGETPDVAAAVPPPVASGAGASPGTAGEPAAQSAGDLAVSLGGAGAMLPRGEPGVLSPVVLTAVPGGVSFRARVNPGQPGWAWWRLMVDGVLAKDTHETTIRLAPPLVIEQHDLDLAIDKLLKVLH